MQIPMTETMDTSICAIFSELSSNGDDRKDIEDLVGKDEYPCSTRWFIGLFVYIDVNDT